MKDIYLTDPSILRGEEGISFWRIVLELSFLSKVSKVKISEVLA